MKKALIWIGIGIVTIAGFVVAIIINNVEKEKMFKNLDKDNKRVRLMVEDIKRMDIEIEKKEKELYELKHNKPYYTSEDIIITSQDIINAEEEIKRNDEEYRKSLKK